MKRLINFILRRKGPVKPLPDHLARHYAAQDANHFNPLGGRAVVLNMAEVNRALRPLGLQLQSWGDNNHHFTSRRHGRQIGSIFYEADNRKLTIERLLKKGRAAIKQHRRHSIPTHRKHLHK